MRFALMIHPNSVPEVLSRAEWTPHEIEAVLGAEQDAAEYFRLGRRLLLWQAQDSMGALNLPAEQLVGNLRYLRLRGPVLVTRTKPVQGMTRADLAAVAAQLVAYREQLRGSA